MIIRILGEGQFEVAETGIDELNRLDDRVLVAVETGDDAAFGPALHELLATVRRLGEPLADASLVVSELVLPAADSEPAQIRALLGDDGLIPG